MNKYILGSVIVLIGGVWTVACLFADALGLGPIIFGFPPGSSIGRIQLVFIFVGVFIVLLGIAVLILIKDKAKKAVPPT